MLHLVVGDVRLDEVSRAGDKCCSFGFWSVESVLDPAIPIVNYVSPTVWAWRPGRARAMRKYVDHVLALLPFEPEAYQRLRGPPCSVA